MLLKQSIGDLAVTMHYYTDPPPDIWQAQQYLLDRDSQRTDEFKDQWCAEPFGYLVSLRERRVIGRVRLYRRTIVHYGKQVLLGGIGFVATVPECRGQGIARTLVGTGMERLSKEGCEVGFLCCRIEDPHKIQLYEQFGYVLLGKDFIYQGSSGKLYARNNGMVAPITSQSKFKHILTSPDPLDLGIGVW